MADDTPQYEGSESYNGYVIRRFRFLQSGGGFTDPTETDEVIQYYHYHVFKEGDESSGPLHEAGSPVLAHQLVDTLTG